MHTRAQKSIDALTREVFEMSSYPRHVAYLFRKSKLIATSTNTYERHAELGVLPYVTNGAHGYRLYVRRLGNRDQLSRPCYHCSLQLKRRPNVRVFYTSVDGAWLEDSDLDNAHLSKWWKARARPAPNRAP